MRGRLLTRRGLLRAAALAAVAAPLPLAGCAWRSLPWLTYAPPLWRLDPSPTGPAESGWLLGTVHSGLARQHPWPESVETAWQRTRTLAVELDATRHAATLRALFAERALLPDGGVLDEHVAADELRALRRQFGWYEAEWRGLRRLQPWALALQMPDPDEARVETRPEHGMERRLLQRARAEGRPVTELETPLEQVEALTGGDFALRWTAVRARAERVRARADTAARLLAAWRTGDLHALAALKDEAFGTTRADDPRAPLRDRIFGVRDRRIAQRVAEQLAADARPLVAVGALHLVGAGALGPSLRERGVSVVPVREGTTPRDDAAGPRPDDR